MGTPARSPEMLAAFVEAYKANGEQPRKAAIAVNRSGGSGHEIFAACVRAGLLEPKVFWKPVKQTTTRDAHDNIVTTHVQQKPDTGDCIADVPPSFALSKITIAKDGGEAVRSWEQYRPGGADMLADVRAFTEALAEPVRGMSPVVAEPHGTDDDLLVVYPMGDPHFGLYSWAEEAGENFDLAEAERVTCAAIDRLVALAPNASEATLLNLGDYYHSDSGGNETTKGTPVDVDGRSQKVTRVGVKAMRWCILRLLEKHKHVRVRNVAGNHDGNAHFALAVAMEAYFENDPRVTIDMSPAKHTFQAFGKVLIGECHGDTTKAAMLPGVMMCDARAHISETSFWIWHCGHVHHDSIKEYQNVVVETHRTLAAKDAWHAGQGYRSGRTMKSITYHREYGEVHRSTCDIAMIRRVA